MNPFTFPQPINTNGQALGTEGQPIETLPAGPGHPTAWAGPGVMPQTLLGSWLGSTVGRCFGGLAAQPGAGNVLAGGAAAFLPLLPTPQQHAPALEAPFDPLGLWSALKHAATAIPAVMSTAQQVAQVAQVLPLLPTPQQHAPALEAPFDPLGLWSALKQVATAIPAVMSTAQQVAQYLPFHAGLQPPQQPVAQYLAFQAGPQLQPQAAPGWGGDWISQLARAVGSPTGGALVQALPGAAPSVPYLPFLQAPCLPFHAGPPLQPPPALPGWGDWISQLARAVGSPTGGALVQALPGAAPSVPYLPFPLGQCLPFHAGPPLQPALPGWGGDWISQLARAAGSPTGGALVQALPGAAPSVPYLPFPLGQCLPFHAGPQPALQHRSTRRVSAG